MAAPVNVNTRRCSAQVEAAQVKSASPVPGEPIIFSELNAARQDTRDHKWRHSPSTRAATESLDRHLGVLHVDIQYWDEYGVEGSAMIGYWQISSSHSEHLICLAHLFEDVDGPAALLTLAEMVELHSIFQETAQWFVQRGIHDRDGSLQAEDKHLRERIQAMQALSDDRESTDTD